MNAECLIERNKQKFPEVSLEKVSSREIGLESPNSKIIDLLRELIYYNQNGGQANQFRILSFKRAIQSLEKCNQTITTKSQALALDGVGKGIADRIEQFSNLGYLPELENLKKSQNNQRCKAVQQLGQINGIGIKTAEKIYDKTGVTTPHELRQLYIYQGWLLGNLLNRQIKIGLKYFDDFNSRIPYWEMIELDKDLNNLITNFSTKFEIDLKYQICGSYRREKPDSGDIDVLLTTNNKQETPQILSNLVNFLYEHDFLVYDLSLGQHKYMGVCNGKQNRTFKNGKTRPMGRRIDLLILQPDEWATGLLYFTGSGEFNRRMRAIAIQRGFTLSEHGLYLSINGQKTSKVLVTCEREIFEILRIRWLEPPDRELGKGH